MAECQICNYVLFLSKISYILFTWKPEICQWRQKKPRIYKIKKKPGILNKINKKLGKNWSLNYFYMFNSKILI